MKNYLSPNQVMRYRKNTRNGPNVSIATKYCIKCQQHKAVAGGTVRKNKRTGRQRFTCAVCTQAEKDLLRGVNA